MLDPRRLVDVHPGAGAPGVVNCIIETPKGKRNRYEADKATGLIRLDRYLHSASHYPGDYGFVPRTLAQDGDPIDVLVMVNEPTFSGCLIEARIVAGFKTKVGGAIDYKVLAVPNTDPLFAEFQDLDDVPKHFLREVEHFFVSYKQLEGVAIDPQGWDHRDAAVATVSQALGAFVPA